MCGARPHWLRGHRAIKFTPHRDTEEDLDGVRIGEMDDQGCFAWGWRRVYLTTVTLLKHDNTTHPSTPPSSMRVLGHTPVTYRRGGSTYLFHSNMVHETVVTHENITKIALFWGEEGVGTPPHV